MAGNRITVTQWLQGIGAIAVLIMGANALGWLDSIKSFSVVDNSPVIHFRTDKDVADIANLRMSLPEDTYIHFDLAFQNIMAICAASVTATTLDKSDECPKKNLDGKTVNQIIALGKKLGDTSLSVNDKIAMVQ